MMIKDDRRRADRRRGPRGKTGKTGPKGDPGHWPTEAFDLLEARIDTLNRDLEELRNRFGSLAETLTDASNNAGKTGARRTGFDS